MILFDCTKQESFNDVEGYVKEATRYCPNGLKLIVANKIDLADERVISTSQGQTLASELNISYFEVSALTGADVNELFALVASKLASHGQAPRRTTSTWFPFFSFLCQARLTPSSCSECYRKLELIGSLSNETKY